MCVLQQPRIICALFKEATPYVPVASSLCLTGELNVSRIPVLLLSSVSMLVSLRCPLQQEDILVHPSWLDFSNKIDFMWTMKQRYNFFLSVYNHLIPHEQTEHSIFFPPVDNTALWRPHFLM